MGEESEPLPAEATMPATVSHSRLLVEMAGLIIAAAAVGFAFAGKRFGFGVLLGGALSLLNYFWLKRLMAAIFEKALSGGRARFLPLRFILRYVAIGLVLLVIYFSDVIPVAAVILGLAAFALAVMVDGIYSIFTSSFEKEV